MATIGNWYWFTGRNKVKKDYRPKAENSPHYASNQQHQKRKT
jgi:hypothetical protein